MRWPLKYQIALPMAAVMLLGVAAASGLNALMAASGTRSRIEEQLRDVAAIISATNFPLTDGVLTQLRGLSGAHFVLVDETGKALASSGPELNLAPELPELTDGAADVGSDLALEDPIQVQGASYFHGRVASRPSTSGEARVVHMLYPVAEYEAAWQRAVLPSLAVLALALPASVLLAVATAARISRRTGRLQQQLRKIAGGNFHAAPLPGRDDELRDLAEGVNRMAAMLASSEEKVRKSERMQTLAQLGGAVAHQLRNSVTGCRMALDLHAEDCPLAAGDEALGVARRQLELMEEYVRRFLRLGKADAAARELEEVELRAVIDEVLPLVEPAARHARVSLAWKPPDSEAVVWADRMEVSQLLINLVLNGIEAAAGHPAAGLSGCQVAAGGNGSPPQVRIEIERADDARLRLSVSDTGPGPAAGLRDTLLEPFVSDKVDGVGLGLSVVRTIARQHGAQLSWHRDDGWTRFVVEFPSRSRTLEATSSQACV
jgi:signal transduction histidine kinase